MNHSIFLENQKKRLDHPLWLLICFSMFCFWQMGFIYFMGPSLTIDGKTPLPISMDNITTLIALAYVLCIIYMIVFPRYVITAVRTSAILSLITVLGLFLPLSDNYLKLLIYLQVFLCCFMIGFETFMMVNYFSENNTINHLTIAYGVSLLLISIVQNDYNPITFPVFRLLTIIALILFIIFLFHMPVTKEACPRYVKKADGIVAPKKLITGTFILVFISSLMAVSGPSISGEIKHGVFITYLCDAIASLLIYFLYKKANIYPFRSISICMSLGCVGFLFMFVSTYIPELSYIGCAFIGFGMIPCQMIPLYNLILMKSYPCRYYSSITIGLALVAVLVQGSMVEFFRNVPNMLYLAYEVIMVILVILYLQIEPYFLYTFKKRVTENSITNNISEIGIHNDKDLDSTVTNEETSDSKTNDININPDNTNENLSEYKTNPSDKINTSLDKSTDTTVNEIKNIIESDDTSDNPLNVLTKRELEVADLISYGYSNANIAKILFISEHTVKDHTKNIYRKLNVHSRFELAALVNRIKANVKS